ncbi:MAG: DUF1275 family protein [Phycisphaeraceae bacterium]|nr:DUF1275 family protein [Phycisphaeraceae bacterium]MCW5767820.1 DUF1275 family protein [Phycisphaeraceae bacterium]
MFVAQAHSFVQQARLAITLAWVAGYTNIITFLVCGTVTSHVSGTTSNLGRDVVEGLRGTEGAWSLAGYALFLLATFLAGAFLSGITTELGRRRGWDSIYVLPMALQALFLTLFMLALRLTHTNQPPPHQLVWISGIASFAMGLQNATITRISSGVVRTTHVTGVLTDLGIELAHLWLWVRDRDLSKLDPGVRARVTHTLSQPVIRRVALLASILGSFALGAGLGTVAFDYARTYAMVPPVAFLLWIVLVDAMRPIAAIEPSDLVANGAGEGLPPAIRVYHIRQDRSRRKGRRAKLHSLPNMTAWAERLGDEVRVVILDLADVTQLDGDAAFELRSLLALFKAQDRHLVLAGVSHEQYHQLRRAGAGEMLEPMSACPDFELAVARGLAILQEHGLA